LEENLVKKTCKELGITQKELAEKVGIKPESLNSSVSRGKVSKQIINQNL
jgi:DNA-binding XRE family transcriptional regulator